MTVAIPIPSSKSLTQRALVLAAFADGPSELRDPLDCDDSRHLVRALSTFGARFEERRRGALRTLCVTPARFPLVAPSEPLVCGNAGTALRFTAPLALACEGPLVLDGDARMRARPIGPLADALAAMGVDVRYLGARGCPPVALRRVRPCADWVAIDGSLSSQFASGLLLVAPLLPGGLGVTLTGARVSRPYLEMTIAALARAGCDVRRLDEANLRVASGRPRGGVMTVERDWSAAAFVLVAARIAGVDVVPEGLGAPEDSLQGDAAVVAMLAGLDRAPVNELDLTDVPDLIAPLAVAALFARTPTRIRGAAHTRVKECDRVAVLARELGRLGARLEAHPDGLDVWPLDGAARAATASDTVTLDPEDDHRMAMAFGIASLRLPGLRVANPGCVTKSFPAFWDSLDLVRGAPTAAARDAARATP